jgi:retron-type reverse transcriptase
MKCYGGLFERIVSFENLLLAAKKAWRGKRHKGSVAAFYFNLESELIQLQQELISDTYQPQPYRQFEICEPKIRKISSSHFRDRVVHHAIMNIVEPIWERGLIFDTYACRVGKGTHAALQRARHFTRRFRYFLKCDIQKYFDSIDHSVLRKIILGKIKDRQLLALLEKIIAHELPGSASGRGLPIGNLTSQHFANLYLSGLDHHLKETLRVPGYVRYMDDFICFSDEKGSLQAILREIRLYLKEQLGLVLKEKVVKIAPVSEGVPFLGCRVFRGNIRLQRQNMIRLRRKIRKNETLFLHGKITEKKLVQSVGSMVAHASHANTTMVRRHVFGRLFQMA